MGFEKICERGRKSKGEIGIMGEWMKGGGNGDGGYRCVGKMGMGI